MGLGSFIGDAMGFLFGGAAGGGKANKPDWDAIMRLMELEQELNRTNRQGIFGGWNWEEGPDGTWTQQQTLAPGMQQGADRLMARSQGQGFDPYTSPDQFSQLLDAKMANQMGRHGILQPGEQQPQTPFGQPSAEREGRFAQAFTPQPPPEPQAQAQQPPGLDIPPGMHPAWADMMRRGA